MEVKLMLEALIQETAASFARRFDMMAEFAEVPCQEEQKGQPKEEEVQVTKSKWDCLSNAFCRRYNRLQQ